MNLSNSENGLKKKSATVDALFYVFMLTVKINVSQNKKLFVQLTMVANQFNHRNHQA